MSQQSIYEVTHSRNCALGEENKVCVQYNLQLNNSVIFVYFSGILQEHYDPYLVPHLIVAIL